MNKMGEQMLQARKANNLKQENMADIMGVTPSQICKWEKGKIEMSQGYIYKFQQFMDGTHYDIEMQRKEMASLEDKLSVAKCKIKSLEEICDQQFRLIEIHIKEKNGQNES